MRDVYKVILEEVLQQPSLAVVNNRLPALSAIELANVLSWAYNGLRLHHLDQQAKAYEK